MAGRPVRFVGVVIGGWVLFRVTVLVSVVPDPSHQPYRLATLYPQIASRAHLWSASVTGHAPLRHTATARTIVTAGFSAALADGLTGSQPRGQHNADISPDNSARAPAPAGHGWSDTAALQLIDAAAAFVGSPHAPAGLNRYSAGSGNWGNAADVPVIGASPPPQARRWSGASWLLVRNATSSQPTGGPPRLGASQTGLRFDYALAATSPFRPSAYGRISSALQSPAAAEGAIGLAVRIPAPLPVSLAVERRFGLSAGGQNAAALLVAGGVYHKPVAAGFSIDGYGEAGIVGVDTKHRDSFADGRLTIDRPVLTARRAVLALGGSLSGGAQLSASRLDVGPVATVQLPIGGVTVRLGTEWRARIAGNAAPDSGLAFSVTSNF